RSIAVGAGLQIANGEGTGGNPTISPADDLAALEALDTIGIVRRSAPNTWATSPQVAFDEVSTTAWRRSQEETVYAARAELHTDLSGAAQIGSAFIGAGLASLFDGTTDKAAVACANLGAGSTSMWAGCQI